MKKSIPFLIATLLVIGCDEAFEPNGPYQPQLVLYSVLDAGTDTQFVRLQTTVDPRSYDPFAPFSPPAVTGATVVLQDNGISYTFRDTVISVTEGSGTRLVPAYVHYQCRIVSNRQYQLTAVVPGFPVVTATAIGLNSAFLHQVNTKVLFNPINQEDISFDLFLGRNAKAYLLLFTIEYERLRNGVWIMQRYDVPSSVIDGKKIYPQISLSPGIEPFNKVFPLTLYNAAIAEIRSNPLDTVRFGTAVFTLLQFDTPLYTYYSVANNYPGGSTLRLDEPDFSNVSGGYGVVGVTNKFVARYALTANP